MRAPPRTRTCSGTAIWICACRRTTIRRAAGARAAWRSSRTAPQPPPCSRPAGSRIRHGRPRRTCRWTRARTRARACSRPGCVTGRCRSRPGAGRCAPAASFRRSRSRTTASAGPRPGPFRPPRSIAGSGRNCAAPAWSIGWSIVARAAGWNSAWLASWATILPENCWPRAAGPWATTPSPWVGGCASPTCTRHAHARKHRSGSSPSWKPTTGWAGTPTWPGSARASASWR